MANYLNLPDTIPQLTPFNPNLNYYAGVLSTKQQQYDQGLSKLNSIYRSALASPMLRSDNNERRDQYFKTITQDIQKIAKLDLSIDQNVSTAKQLFNPILNDKAIVKDMAFTKQLGKAFNTAEQYRHCVDPDKCGGEYWETGVQALNYAAEEFKNASAAEAMRFQAPSYVPAQNVTKKAIAAAKAAGFNVSYDHTEGRYIVTDTNGALLLGDRGDGVLPQYLLGMFGNDAAVQGMYSTQAYVQRKNYAKQNAGKFGGDENAAESEYLNTIIAQTTPKLERSKQDLYNLRNQLSTDQRALETQFEQQGGVLPGDPVANQYDRLIQLMNGTKNAETYHENVSNLINTAPNLNDLRQLRSRADNIVANGMFMDTIQKAAYEYAIGTAKRELKADPYALASFNNSLDISKGKALQNHEFAIWQEKERIKGVGETNALKRRLGMKEGDSRTFDAYFASKGITPEMLNKQGLSPNVGDWTKSDFDKAGTLGLYGAGQGQAVEVTDLAGGVSTEDTYVKNGKLIVKAADDMMNSGAAYLKDSFERMKAQYLAPTGGTPAQQKAIRDKIYNNMTSILAGTGITPEAIINGTVGTDIFGKELPRFNKSLGRAVSLQEKDVASNVITGQWSPEALLKYQRDKQVAEGFVSRKYKDNKEIKEEMLATVNVGKNRGEEIMLPNASGIPSIPSGIYKGESSDDVIRRAKNTAMIAAIADDYGLVSKKDAFERYRDATKHLYGEAKEAGIAPEEFESLMKSTTGIDYRTAEAKAMDDFNAEWGKKVQEYSDKVKSWEGIPGSTGGGGGEAPAKAYSYSLSGEEKLSPQYAQFKNIVSEIGNAPVVVGASGVGTLSDFEFDANKNELANRLFQKYKAGETKGLDVSYDLRVQEEVFTSADRNAVVPKGAFMNVRLGDDAVRELYPEIKKTEPIPDNLKSFTVRIPATEKTPTTSKFVQQATPSNTDIYMRSPGATLSQNVPNVGEFVITRRDDGHLQATGKFNTFDPVTYEPISREFVPEVFDKDITYDVAQSRWNRNMDMAKQRLEYLKKQAILLN